MLFSVAAARKSITAALAGWTLAHELLGGGDFMDPWAGADRADLSWEFAQLHEAHDLHCDFEARTGCPD